MLLLMFQSNLWICKTSAFLKLKGEDDGWFKTLYRHDMSSMIASTVPLIL
jgi:hypothetical protein